VIASHNALVTFADCHSAGSRGPAVLDDFTASYGYKFADASGYQWPQTQIEPNKL